MPRPSHKSPINHPAQTDFAASLFENHPYASLIRETHSPAVAVPPWTQLPEYLPVFGIKLVRAEYIRLAERPRIRSPQDAVRIAWEHLQHSDREQMVSILVDAKTGVIGMNIISVGDLSSAIVHPREVYKAAILANASSLILAHNHPSGDPTPSPEDIAITRQLYEAGRILGIDLLDHVVIGDESHFTSLKERSWF